MFVVACLNGLFAFEAYYQDEKNYSIGSHLWRHPLNGVVSSPKMESGFIPSNNKLNVIMYYTIKLLLTALNNRFPDNHMANFLSKIYKLSTLSKLSR